MQVLEAIRTIGRTLMDGARALFAHWPVLLTIFFLGKAASAGLLWLAVMASKYSPVAGMLLLPGAPIAMLVAIILMLRAVIPSVPELADTFSPRSGVAWWRSEMTLVVQVLVPFLAVYASQGWMKEDLRTYMYYATADEWMSEGFAADFTRVSFGTEAQIFAIVMIAMVLRKVIAGFELGKKHLPVAGFAGYLEALWLVVAAAAFSAYLGDLRGWAMSRAVIVWLKDTLATFYEWLGPVKSVFDWVASLVGTIFGSMGVLLIVPVAWIAVGATIYGHSLPAAKPLLTSEEITKRIKQIPNPIRRATSQVFEPVVGPVRNTLRAIGRVAIAGVIPMVLLCVIFAATSQLRVLTVAGLRRLVGPRSEGFWIAATPYIDAAAQAVYITAMVVLLAAAVGVVVRGQRELAAKVATEAEAASVAGTQPASAEG